MIERLENGLDPVHTQGILDTLSEAQDDFVGQTSVSAVATQITDRLEEMAGSQHGTTVALGLASFKRESLLRELQIVIDGGARGIAQASSGTANLIFFALKTLELDLLVNEGERDHTFLGVEEPEAHLHPHVQRLIYRYLLTDAGREDSKITPILTTHSPHIASVAPLRSIVLLRRGIDSRSTAHSVARAPLEDADVDDLQRYIDVTRGEMFFARGVVLVEGDAEKFLVPAFALAIGIDLDELGITVSSVAGTNFLPYAKLLGATALAVPFVVLTDRDPRDGGIPLARNRVRKLLAYANPATDYNWLPDADLFEAGENSGIFVNDHTLEIDLVRGPLGPAITQCLVTKLGLSAQGSAILQGWLDNPVTLDTTKFLAVVERVGKGRLAQRLAQAVNAANCPEYIRAALVKIRDAVS